MLPIESGQVQARLGFWTVCRSSKLEMTLERSSNDTATPSDSISDIATDFADGEDSNYENSGEYRSRKAVSAHYLYIICSCVVKYCKAW